MKMTLSRKVYEPLPVNDADNDGSSEKLLGADETTVSPKAASHRSPWIMHLGIFSLYTITFLGLSAHFFDRNPKRLKDGCLLEQSMYSPVHEVVEYSVIRFNGSLDFSSPYKGHPSAALDEAWDRITTNNSLWPMRISDKDLEKINKGGRGSNVKYREIDGGGNMASVEVFHQLHCLNMLRKYTYPKEYPELHELWKTQPKFIRGHLDHCIDMIRQNLMCVADVGMISYDWISGWDVPFPDFNTYHKCRNFDAILDWATKHRVRIPQDHMGRIGNEINLPEPPI
ncbi:hypothetical protein CPB84DRAFT_1959751 [Gymnopilus junonius]|uniref:Tat pathway signal sequence n=1 Tax=Gymnopilus junonius TaxID=109634 RepID=A0A9P5NVW0_GYMJU|nr:hypothetical protein CPB84DRAFT_1959751 [Gymnopilus junonius]